MPLAHVQLKSGVARIEANYRAFDGRLDTLSVATTRTENVELRKQYA